MVTQKWPIVTCRQKLLHFGLITFCINFKGLPTTSVLWGPLLLLLSTKSAGSLTCQSVKNMRERNETMEESLLDITADSVDSNSEKRLVNRYSS